MSAKFGVLIFREDDGMKYMDDGLNFRDMQ